MSHGERALQSPGLSRSHLPLARMKITKAINTHASAQQLWSARPSPAILGRAGGLCVCLCHISVPPPPGTLPKVEGCSGYPCVEQCHPIPVDILSYDAWYFPFFPHPFDPLLLFFFSLLSMNCISSLIRIIIVSVVTFHQVTRLPLDLCWPNTSSWGCGERAFFIIKPKALTERHRGEMERTSL